MALLGPLLGPLLARQHSTFFMRTRGACEGAAQDLKVASRTRPRGPQLPQRRCVCADSAMHMYVCTLVH